MNKPVRLILLFTVGIVCASIASAATYTVTKTADTNDGSCSLTDCSLREAIVAANSTTENDTINFNIPTGDPGCSSGVCTITLNSSLGQLTINSTTTAGTLTITNVGGSQKIEISGNNATGVFQVSSGANLTINSLTVRNGSAPNGGGIANEGTVTIINSTISNNTAFEGGGIFNFGTATIINSTISNNFANGGSGFLNLSMATIINSTISNNSTSGNGGGIFNSVSGTVSARNTIIANNSASSGPDFVGTLNSQGYNLIGNTNGTTITGTTTGNILNQDPKLAPLGNYGGPTRTHALLLDSPAINAGDNSSAPATDQRGFTRISDATIDIGAVELQVFNVTNTNDSGSGSLRNALSLSDQFADDNIVKFNIPSTDPNCSIGVCTVKLSSELQVNSSAVLVTNASGINQIRISGENASRIFHVLSGAELRTESITVINGNDSTGGGFFNEGTLVLSGTTVRGNFVSGSGGGIYNNFGNLTLLNSTVSTNTAVGSGGGIYNFFGTVNLFNSTISHNTVTNNGGGGVVNAFGTFNARNTLFANNSASSGPDFLGTLNSQGNNLIGNTSGTSGTTGSDIVNTNPRLTPLER